MSEEKKQVEFIPEISINNTKKIKEVEIDGEKQEVEVPAQEGFNIKTRNLDGNYEKNFFLKDLEAVILFDRYQIQSKYGVSPLYMSNEFEFMGDRNKVRVYCPETKSVIYEGNYKGAKEHFATGQQTKAGTPEKSFDIFTLLYVLISGEVFKFRWKLNQNSNWFDYKDNCSESRNDNGYRNFTTKFSLSKKKFGSNEFWVCDLLNVGKSKEDAQPVAIALEKKLDDIANSYSGDQKETEAKDVTDDEVVVEDLPF